MIVRAYLVGNRLYILIASETSATSSTRFLDSFELDEPGF